MKARPSLARALAEGAVRGVIARRGITLAATLLALGAAYAAIGAAVGAPPRVPVDNGVGIWFLDADPAMRDYRAFQATFGNDEAVLVGLKFDEPGGVFSAAGLTTVAELASRCAAVPDVRGVTSLATVLHTGTGPEGEIVVDRLYRAPLPAEASAVIALVESRVVSNPLYRDSLVSPPGPDGARRTTLLTIQLRPGPEEMDLKRAAILAQLRTALETGCEAVGRPRDAFWWGGMGVTNERLNYLSTVDALKLFAVSTLVLIGMLWLALRRIGAVLLATTTVYIAQTCMLGAYFASGLKLNLVTMILPTLVMVIGLTDAIFFITTWDQERDQLDREGLTKTEALARCLGFCLLPGLFNSVTSAVGFLAFLGADMRVLRHLGLFSGLGILLAFVASVVVCTLGLWRFELRPRAATGGGKPDNPIERLIAAITRFVLRRRRAVLAAGALLALAGVGGVLRIEVDTLTIGYFKEKDPVRVDNDAIEAHFGPYLPLEVVVDSGAIDGIKEPAVLRGMDALAARVDEREAKVGSAVSIAGVVKRINQVWHDEAPEGYRVPDTREAVEQELVVYDPQREDDPLELIDFPGWQKGRVTFRTRNGSASEAKRLLGGIEADAKELVPAPAKVAPAGYLPLYITLIDYLVWGQVWSLSTTFLVVFAILVALFRSVRYALVSLPANLLPVLLTMGFMGYAGIHLDVATVLIASIALGLAVDDTIHFVFKFRELHLATGDVEQATVETLRSTGVAIATSSSTMAVGFLVLAFAGIKSIAVFGVLMAVTMLAAFVTEVFITPAVVLEFGGGSRPAGEAAPPAGPGVGTPVSPA